MHSKYYYKYLKYKYKYNKLKGGNTKIIIFILDELVFIFNSLIYYIEQNDVKSVKLYRLHLINAIEEIIMDFNKFIKIIFMIIDISFDDKYFDLDTFKSNVLKNIYKVHKYFYPFLSSKNYDNIEGIIFISTPSNNVLKDDYLKQFKQYISNYLLEDDKKVYKQLLKLFNSYKKGYVKNGFNIGVIYTIIFGIFKMFGMEQIDFLELEKNSYKDAYPYIKSLKSTDFFTNKNTCIFNEFERLKKIFITDTTNIEQLSHIIYILYNGNSDNNLTYDKLKPLIERILQKKQFSYLNLNDNFIDKWKTQLSSII